MVHGWLESNIIQNLISWRDEVLADMGISPRTVARLREQGRELI